MRRYFIVSSLRVEYIYKLISSCSIYINQFGNKISHVKVIISLKNYIIPIKYIEKATVYRNIF